MNDLKSSPIHTASSRATPSPAELWPDDWYVFEDGVIHGPLQAAEAFSERGEDVNSQAGAQTATQFGSQRLVSRRGFSQWYPVRHLSELYAIERDAVMQSPEGQSYAHQIQQDIERMLTLKQHTSETGQAVLRSTSTVQANQATHTTEKVQKKTLTPPPIHKEHPATAYKDHPGTQNACNISRPTPPATGSHVGGTHPLHASSQTGEIRLQQSTVLPTTHAMMQHYFILRGRLRLGHIRSTWLVPTLGFIATLGFITPIWMLDLKREIHFHRHPNARSSSGFVWLSLIPFLHIYSFLKLAKEVQAMEHDNNYQKTRSWLTGLLALVPPFAMMYLQGQVNHHWQLHIRHELATTSQATSA